MEPPGLTPDNGSGPQGRYLAHAVRDGKHSAILTLMGVVQKLTAAAIILPLRPPPCPPPPVSHA